MRPWASVEPGRCPWRCVLPCEAICVPSSRILISVFWWPSGSPLGLATTSCAATDTSPLNLSSRAEGSAKTRKRICFGNTTHAPSRGEVERIVSNVIAFWASDVRSCALRQWLRGGGAPGRLHKKLRKWDLKCLSQPVQKIDRGVLRLPFQAADVGAVDPGVIGEPLLRNSAFDADPRIRLAGLGGGALLTRAI